VRRRAEADRLRTGLNEPIVLIRRAVGEGDVEGHFLLWDRKRFSSCCAAQSLCARCKECWRDEGSFVVVLVGWRIAGRRARFPVGSPVSGPEEERRRCLTNEYFSSVASGIWDRYRYMGIISAYGIVAIV
jgi:hypothetical protein